MSDNEYDDIEEEDSEEEIEETKTKSKKPFKIMDVLNDNDDEDDEDQVDLEDDDADDQVDLDDEDDDDDDEPDDLDDDEVGLDKDENINVKKQKKSKKIKNAVIEEDDDDVNLDDEDDEDDEDQDEDDNYLQKFDDNLSHSIIENYHPELHNHNYEEIEKLSTVFRNNHGVVADPLHRTLPFITKYEKARILGERAKQINSGGKVFVEVDEKVIDGYLIALKEYKEKKIPFIIKRPMPNGGCEYWKFKDLEDIC